MHDLIKNPQISVCNCYVMVNSIQIRRREESFIWLCISTREKSDVGGYHSASDDNRFERGIFIEPQDRDPAREYLDTIVTIQVPSDEWKIVASPGRYMIHVALCLPSKGTEFVDFKVES